MLKMSVRKTEQLNGLHIASDPREEDVDEMNNKLPRFQKVTFVLGAAMVTLLCVPCLTHAQSSTTQDRQAVPSDDITRRDLRDLTNFSIDIAKLPTNFAKRLP